MRLLKVVVLLVCSLPYSLLATPCGSGGGSCPGGVEVEFTLYGPEDISMELTGDVKTTPKKGKKLLAELGSMCKIIFDGALKGQNTGITVRFPHCGIEYFDTRTGVWKKGTSWTFGVGDSKGAEEETPIPSLFLQIPQGDQESSQGGLTGDAARQLRVISVLAGLIPPKVEVKPPTNLSSPPGGDLPLLPSQATNPGDETVTLEELPARTKVSIPLGSFHAGNGKYVSAGILELVGEIDSNLSRPTNLFYRYPREMISSESELAVHAQVDILESVISANWWEIGQPSIGERPVTADDISAETFWQVHGPGWDVLENGSRQTRSRSLSGFVDESNVAFSELLFRAGEDGPGYIAFLSPFELNDEPDSNVYYKIFPYRGSHSDLPAYTPEQLIDLTPGVDRQYTRADAEPLEDPTEPMFGLVYAGQIKRKDLTAAALLQKFPTLMERIPAPIQSPKFKMEVIDLDNPTGPPIVKTVAEVDDLPANYVISKIETPEVDVVVTPLPETASLVNALGCQVVVTDKTTDTVLQTVNFRPQDGSSDLAHGIEIDESSQGVSSQRHILADAAVGTGQTSFSGEMDESGASYWNGRYLESSPVVDDQRMVYTVEYAEGQVVSSVMEVYQLFPWGEERIQRVSDPTPGSDGKVVVGPDCLIEQWEYYPGEIAEFPPLQDAPDGAPDERVVTLGRLKSYTSNEGAWQFYQYNSQGAPMVFSPYGTAPPMTQPIPDNPSPSDLPDNTQMTMTVRAPDGGDEQQTYAKVGGVSGKIGCSVTPPLSSGIGELGAGHSQTQKNISGPGFETQTETVYLGENYSYSPGDGALPRYYGLPAIVRHSSGKTETYVYRAGYWNGNVDVSPSESDFFESFDGDDTMTIREEGVEGSPVADHSTRQITINTAANGTVYEETQIYDGGDWKRATWTAYVYDQRKRLIRTIKDGFTVSWTDYGADEFVTTTYDIAGHATQTHTDKYDRTIKSLRLAQGTETQTGVGDIVTEYLYEGRKTTVLVNGRIESETIVDCLGRTISETDRLGTTTAYSYAFGGVGGLSQITMTRDGGLSTATFNHADGRTLSVSSSDGTYTEYVYSLEQGDSIEDAYEAQQTLHGSADERRVGVKSVTRWDGSPYKSYIPSKKGVGGIFYERTWNYDTETNELRSISTGAGHTPTQLIQLPRGEDGEPTPQAILGMHRLTGLDHDGDLEADLSSQDRIVESIESFQKINSEWYRVSKTKRYIASGNGPEGFVESSRLSRLNLSGSENAIETSYEKENLETGGVITSITVVDPSKLETVAETLPVEAGGATVTSVNGYQISVKRGPQAPTELRYDSRGLLVREKDPLGGFIRHTYDQNDQRVSTTDAAGNVTRYTYYPGGHHAAGRVESVTNAEGETTLTTYNLRGQVANIRGTGTYHRDYQYNAHGELSILTTYRDGNTSQKTGWFYDNDLGGAMSYKIYDYQDTNGNGRVDLGEVNDKSTHYEYTVEGLVEFRTSARNLRTITIYNQMGELQHKLYEGDSALLPPLVTFSAFNRSGQPTRVSETFPSGLTTTTNLTYDREAGSLQTVNYAQGHPYLSEKSLTYGDPDSFGRPKGYGTDGDSVNYEYDVLGRLQYINETETGSSNILRQHRYHYHPNSNLISEVSSARRITGNQEIHHRRKQEYDLLGRLTSVKNSVYAAEVPGETPAGFRDVTYTGYRHDRVGRRTHAYREDGTHWRYQYNNRGEVIDGTKHLPNGSPLVGQQFAYQYDGIGNRTSASYGGDASGGQRRTITYTSNNENQYTNIQHPRYFYLHALSPANIPVTMSAAGASGGDSLTPVTQEQFWKSAEGLSPVTSWRKQDFTISADGETETGSLWIPPAQRSPQYDADGNLESDGRWVYTWNAENRLIRMETDSSLVNDFGYQRLEFAYDWQGRRIAKTLYEGTSAANATEQEKRRFLYEGWNIVREYVDLKTRAYVWGLDLSGSLQGAGGVGGLLSMRLPYVNSTNGNKVYYPSYDGNGNIQAWSEGNIAQPIYNKMDYDAFGNLVSKEKFKSIHDGEIPFGFSTKYTDEETGLCYYGYRYYDPVTGRWPSRDPIEERGGTNLYGFNFNSPTKYIDVLGHQPGIYPGTFPGQDPTSPSDNPFAGDHPFEGWPEAFGDLIDWLKGNTPSQTDYPCDHPKSKAMSNSSIGKKLEKGYLDKFSDKPCKDWKDYTNVKLKFGPKEFFDSLPNGTSHFVGSGRGDAHTIEINEKECWVKAKFTVTNTTSLKSGLYHLIPNSWNNTNTGTPAANWTQTYCWKKKFKCKKK